MDRKRTSKLSVLPFLARYVQASFMPFDNNSLTTDPVPYPDRWFGREEGLNDFNLNGCCYAGSIVLPLNLNPFVLLPRSHPDDGIVLITALTLMIAYRPEHMAVEQTFSCGIIVRGHQ